MNILDKAQLLVHIARWRLTWNDHDIDEAPPAAVRGNPKFISARDAVALIPDGANIFSSGMAANARCSIFFWAMRDRFEKTGHPKGLTWMVVGAQGSRGMVPGTLEELHHPGLVTRFIAGHLETVKALLKNGDAGLCELHTLAQGQEAFILEAKARGEAFVESTTGLGTRLDPRVGPGSYVGGAPMRENFVEIAGDRLRYRLPRIDFSLFVAPYADAEGNIYKRHAATMTESYESALAAKAEGGMVIASVADIVPKNEAEIFIPADKVDRIVVNSRSEQTGSVRQRRYWPAFTAEHKVDVPETVERLRFANAVLRITPVRTPIEHAMARLSATLFMRISKPGALVNIGVGLAEEVGRLVYENGHHRDITFFTETGVLGGLPSPGIFFGSAVQPDKIITSAQIFHEAYKRLDTALFGLLEVDGAGNVNVSKRGPKMLDYVGTGGLPDLASAARNIVFTGSWMAHADIRVEDGKVVIRKPGPYKFRESVTEISFSGRRALEEGKQILYVTSVGAFRLTEKGLALEYVMPGIDVERDIVRACPMPLAPMTRPPEVVSPEIVTGRGFRLEWPGG